MNIQGGFMNLQEVFQELTEFRNAVEMELTKVGNVMYDDSSMDERFLYMHYQELMSEMDYIIESIEYINKPLIKCGVVNLKNQKLYLNDFEIEDGDTIEVLLEDEWQKVDIYKIRGKFSTDLIDSIMCSYGRIRLNEREANERLMQG